MLTGFWWENTKEIFYLDYLNAVGKVMWKRIWSEFVHWPHLTDSRNQWRRVV